jgi:hypothetical protein
MKSSIIVAIFLHFNLVSNSQLVDTTKCKELISKGYTQTFCDYNTKYAFKNILFESSLEEVSSKLKLNIHLGASKQYDCTDDDMLRWATVKFDNCIFEFSSTNKLNGIQLQLGSSNSSNPKAYIKDQMSKVKYYLTTYFGQPEIMMKEKVYVWNGYKIYIVISNFDDTDSAVVAIFRTNTKAIDDL